MKNIVSLCFIALGLAVGVYLYAQETMLVLYGVKTEAIITDVFYDGTVGSFADSIKCSVHYVYYDSNLVSRTSFFYLPCGPLNPQWSAGDTISIVFDPNDPTKAAVDNVVVNIMYGVGGLLILCIIVAMLYVVVRKKSRLD
jgi:hypothetical protein